MSGASTQSRNPRATSPAAPRRETSAPPRWWPHRQALLLGLLGGALWWAALPPLQWAPLAWLAPVPWLWLIQQPVLPGRRPWWQLYLAGVVFWLAAIHWLRLPHWATSFGWLALSAYLAVYLPLFVGLSRLAVHRVGVSLLLAAPVVWTGLELARAHVLGGFLMAALGHTQYRLLPLIQMADLFGAYGVSFLVMFVAACLARAFFGPGRRVAMWPLPLAAVAIAAAVGYGLARRVPPAEEPPLRVALIQGSINTEIKSDPQRHQRMLQQYQDLSLRAADLQPDLLVWPETMYPYALTHLTAEPALPPDATYTLNDLRDYDRQVRDELQALARLVKAPVLMGIEVRQPHAAGTARFNSAVLVDPQQPIDTAHRYDKVHLVMFGEYVPGAKRLPVLQRLTPLPSSLEAGTRFTSFQVDGYRLLPNICFESVLPHLIRRGVREARMHDGEPDVLVNLTNDGWFWGSSELDMHLVCGVFRAVENRKPLLIAANTGISAWIDGDGRIIRHGPRQATDVILAEVRRDRRSSPYLLYGDLPAGLCLAVCISLGGFGLVGLVRARRGEAAPARPDDGAAVSGVGL